MNVYHQTNYSMSSRPVLTNLNELINNLYNIVLDKPKEVNTKEVRGYRVPIKVDVDGDLVPLIIATPICFSYGVSYDEIKKTWTLPLVMWNSQHSESETVEERQWVNDMNVLVDDLREKFFNMRHEVKAGAIEPSDLKHIRAFTYRKNKQTGELEKDKSPSMYVKFLTAKEPPNDRLNFLAARFYNRATQQQLCPEDRIGQRCMVQAAIRVEGIWVAGTKVALQLKVHEAHIVKELGGGNYDTPLLSYDVKEKDILL